jgi:hypothetical protein
MLVKMKGKQQKLCEWKQLKIPHVVVTDVAPLTARMRQMKSAEKPLRQIWEGSAGLKEI